MPKRSDSERSITEDELRRIVRRAVEIDAERDGFMSMAEVRSIGAQVGVTGTALNRALDEVCTGRRERTESLTPSGISLPLIACLLGGLVGVALRISGFGFSSIGIDRPEPVLAVLAVQNIAILIALWLKGPGRHWRFHVINAALWLGFFGGWVVMNGFVPHQFPGFVASFAGLTAVFGSAGIVLRDLVTALRRSIAGRFGDSGGIPSKGRSVAQRLARVLNLDLWSFASLPVHYAIRWLASGRMRFRFH